MIPHNYQTIYVFWAKYECQLRIESEIGYDVLKAFVPDVASNVCLMFWDKENG